MNLGRFQEQIFFSTVRITVQRTSGDGASIGTGFLYVAPLENTDQSVILLISNRHVYGTPSQPIALNFHKKNANGDGPSLGDVIAFQQSDFSGMYVGHPDPDVDLACLNVSMIGHPAQNIFYKNLHIDLVADFSDQHLMPGGDIWFIGYPENRFDVRNNLPILRRGHIASIPTVDFNGQRQFVIDAQVYPGSSGSPVFGVVGSSYKFLGVVTQTMIRHEMLQAIPANVALGVQQVLGLGIVLKASLLIELVEEAKRRVLPQVQSKQEPTVSSEEVASVPLSEEVIK